MPLNKSKGNMKTTIINNPDHVLNKQEGGTHYKYFPIQPVEFCHKNGIPFIEGSVIKYVCRHRNKNGAQDLKKAIHFLELLLELEYSGEDPISKALDSMKNY